MGYTDLVGKVNDLDVLFSRVFGRVEMIRILFLPVLIALALNLNALADDVVVQMSHVRKVFDNGEHNAFTDLVKFQGDYYLTFRSCPDGHMVHPTASIIILRSDDLQEWEQVHQFSVPLRDTRDPHFLVFKEKLLSTQVPGTAVRQPSRSRIMT